MTLDISIEQEKYSPPVYTPESNVVIQVHQISKMYDLYTHPTDRLKQSLWYALPQFLRGKPHQFSHQFWALHDMSFEIKKGETVGIIGRNGSGKSTLLQIIAGTLTPTSGYVQVNGRVAALLELGSGFNPEFTGRENVYLNGSILGLTQDEIDNIFGDIVTFANIGQFIDQPVKLYSSGMFVRLAFAVQAFVAKEVFVVDEALAVGDEAFQRKCMAKLDKFRDNGGTVLYVSHDLQTIVRQCERCLLLHEGQLLADGSSKPVTDLYQKLMYSSSQEVDRILTNLRQYGLHSALSETKTEVSVQSLINNSNKLNHTQSPTGKKPSDWFDPNMPETDEVTYTNGVAEIFEYNIYNEQGQRVNVLVIGKRYRLVYRVQFYQEARNVQFGMMIKTVDGLDVAGIASRREQVFFDYISTGSVVEASFSIDLNIVPGTYFLNVGVDGNVDGAHTYLHRRVDVCMIRILPCDSREAYGVAYLKPHFSYNIQSGSSSHHPQYRVK